MQKLISKYSLAAHLGLLTAAPLFLYPYAGARVTGTVMLLLSLFAALWTVMEPSRRRGEMLHDARERLQWSVVRSPLFYSLLFVVGYSLLVFLNSGLSLDYDVESAKWLVSEPRFAGAPASADGRAYPSLAAAVAMLVAGVGVRFGLGRGARAAFLLAFSLLSGLAGFALLLALVDGECAQVIALLRGAMNDGSAVGCVFALAMLAGVGAIPSAFERGWALVTVLFIPAIGGSFAGMFLCSTAAEVIVFSSAAVLLLIFGVVYSVFAVHGQGSLKCLVVFAISIAVGTVALMSFAPEWAGAGRIFKLAEGAILPQDFMQVRSTIDAALIKAWRPVPWIGTGVGTLVWDLRFNVLPEDWLIVPQTVRAALDGWVAALAERGFSGLIVILTPLAVMFCTWGSRLVSVFLIERSSGGGELFRLLDPQIWTGPFAALAVAVAALAGEAAFSPSALLAAGVLCAFSVNVFRPVDIRAAGGKSRSDKSNG